MMATGDPVFADLPAAGLDWDRLAGEVHVYFVSRARRRAGAPTAAELGQLSAGERARAAAFRRPQDAQAYADGRRFLRAVLARYCGGTAAAVPLVQRDSAAKPFLAPGLGLDVSLSRAGGALLAAVGRGRAVGCDLELWTGERGERALRQLPLATALTAEEAAELAQVPTAAAGPTFLSVWTRKEAVIKATGLGLGGLAPTAFSVGVADLAALTAPTGVLRPVAAPAGVSGQWQLHAAVWPGEDAAAAVAARGEPCAVRVYCGAWDQA